jgi:glycosyltransferase involved in cell wall biosynthesis
MKNSLFIEPLVSILMTAYNRQHFISEAIESVIASTYQNWELIIVDDCSKDNTVAIARTYALNDSRIKVFKNEINLGDYPNRNKAISYARGEYIMFCDSDDKLFTNSIDKIIAAINTVANFNFAMYWQHSENMFTLTSSDALRKHFFEQQFLYMGPGGTFIRRSFLNSIGRYPEKYGPANDMYFNLKAVCHTEITLLPFEFVFYRIHEGQELNNWFSYMYNNYRYMRDALLELPLPFTQEEREWLFKKNKRRFAVQLVNFTRLKRDFTKTSEAMQKAAFTCKDIFEGLLYFKKHP